MLKEFTHEDYARAPMESPARERIQFSDAQQHMTMDYSRGRPGGGGAAAGTCSGWSWHFGSADAQQHMILLQPHGRPGGGDPTAGCVSKVSEIDAR